MMDQIPAKYARDFIQSLLAQGISYEDMEDLSGISRHTLKSWSLARKQFVGLYNLDQLACSLGFHLGDIWPDYWNVN